MKSLFLIAGFLFISWPGNAQEMSVQIPSDSIILKETPKQIIHISALSDRRTFFQQQIIPLALTSYGFIALRNKHLLKWVDLEMKEELWDERPHRPMHFDDVLQYVPSLSVYGLHAMGIPGKHDLWTGSKLYLLSSFLMLITVQSTKDITKARRPDGFGLNTFPSGHVSTAFVAAEFLNQEYKDRSPWFGIAGYAIASVVGYMRIYNNRHWFRDCVTGAGMGIGITRLTYWVYPKLMRIIYNRSNHSKKLLY